VTVGKLLNKRLVPVSVRTPQPMVEMGQADPEFKFRCHMGQYPDQGHGIRSPGNGHKYGIARL
jgi:hypothetical protein